MGKSLQKNLDQNGKQDRLVGEVPVGHLAAVPVAVGFLAVEEVLVGVEAQAVGK